MWHMELRGKTKCVLGLPGGIQTVLEHKKNNLKTMSTNPLTVVKDSMFNRPGVAGAIL